jgi:hypothetical protein
MFFRYHLPSYDSLFTAEGKRVRKELNMYKNMSVDDPPMFFANYMKDEIDANYDHFIHSPRHTQHLFERARDLNIDTELYLKDDLRLKNHHLLVLSFFKRLLKKH